jgi:hypothetical protein
MLVSAGGGLVGEPLLRAAVAAQPALLEAEGITTTVVAGPFLPHPAWRRLCRAARRQPGLAAHRYLPHLAREMAASRVSVSQCGYNTAMDILAAGTPAVVVPFSEGREDEQSTRARRLERLGVLRVLEAGELDGASLLGAAPPGAAGPASGAGPRPRRPRRHRPAAGRPCGGLRGTPKGCPGGWGARGGCAGPCRETVMGGWLEPLRRALDAAERPVGFFFRDDDAGWADDRLWSLLDRFAAAALPVDLAVIPAALAAEPARRLRRRVAASGGLVAVHQHGFSHANHERAGRKHEFGPVPPAWRRSEAADPRVGDAGGGVAGVEHQRGVPDDRRPVVGRVVGGSPPGRWPASARADSELTRGSGTPSTSKRSTCGSCQHSSAPRSRSRRASANAGDSRRSATSRL